MSKCNDKHCKYNDEGCIFFAQGSGNPEDMLRAEALKKRFKDIAKSPTNGGLFHIAEILRIIDMEKNNEKNNVQ